MPQEPRLHEVGLRDGLQAEAQIVPLADKVRWARGVMAAGVNIVQLGSFVNPAKVPQMADTDALFAQLARPGEKPAGVKLSALVLNERGLARGLAAGVELYCMGVSASQTHSQRNTGMTPAEAQTRILAMARRALQEGFEVQASVQSAFGCGFEGPIPAPRVLDLVKAYLDAGVRIIALADTAGHAYPQQVRELYGAIRELDADVTLAAHFHNTYGLGLANCLAAIECGVGILETAFGGLGGCPFTRLPAGNVCTEDLVHTLQRMGLRGDVDLAALIAVTREVGTFFGRDLPGLVAKAGSIVHFTGA